MLEETMNSTPNPKFIENALTDAPDAECESPYRSEEVKSDNEKLK